MMFRFGNNVPDGARGGTRTPTPERTTDFKSVASTIPPHGQPHAIYHQTMGISIDTGFLFTDFFDKLSETPYCSPEKPGLMRSANIYSWSRYRLGDKHERTFFSDI